MRCLAALLCLSLAGCGPAQIGAIRIDPALAILVPADATLLAGVRLDALRQTPIYQKYIGQRSMPGLDEFARDTGLDPRKDIWELLVVSDGVNTAVLARGKFSPQGEEPRINRPGVQRIPYKGYTLIGNEQGAVAFMNASVAIAGRPAAVRSIIDGRGRSNGVPPALRSKVDAIPAAAQLWLVAAGGFSQLAKEAPQSGNLSNLGRVFSMLESATVSADLRSGVSLDALGACRTDQDARSLSDALRGLVGLGRLSTPQDQPDMLRVYDAIQVGQQQTTVKVNVKLSQELLDKALAKLPERPRRTQ